MLQSWSFDDPTFQYLPSENPYFKKLEEYPNVFRNHAAEELRGHWRERLGFSGQLHVEIGCNGGHWIRRNAAAYGADQFLGLEVKYKQIYHAAAKAARAGLQNTAWIRGRAERLRFIFGAGEIDHLYVFFPDPWAKRSEQRHRYLTTAWFHSAAELMRPGGSIWIKTDHAEFAGWIGGQTRGFVQAGKHWEVATEFPAEAVLPLSDTLFETVFRRELRKTFYLRIFRP